MRQPRFKRRTFYKRGKTVAAPLAPIHPAGQTNIMTIEKAKQAILNQIKTNLDLNDADAVKRLTEAYSALVGCEVLQQKPQQEQEQAQSVH